MCTSSFLTCCWKVSVEHVGSGLCLFKTDSFVIFEKSIPCSFLYLQSHCISESEEVVEFMEEVITGLLSDQEVRTFEEVMVPVFDIFQGRVKDLDLCQPILYSYLEVLLYFSHNKDISKVRKL